MSEHKLSIFTVASGATNFPNDTFSHSMLNPLKNSLRRKKPFLCSSAEDSQV
jgi:hypothetical protein